MGGFVAFRVLEFVKKRKARTALGDKSQETTTDPSSSDQTQEV